MKVSVELRNQIRRPFFGKINFWVFPGRREEDRKKGRLLDLSGRGLRMLSFEPMLQGQKIRISADQFDAVGTIRWTRKKKIFFWDCYDLGIQFDKFQVKQQSLMMQQRF